MADADSPRRRARSVADVVLVLEESGNEVAELAGVLVVERVEHVASHRAEVMGCGRSDRSPTFVGDDDFGGAGVVGIGSSFDEASFFHAAELMGQATGGPSHERRELREAEMWFGRLGQVRQHFVVGLGELRVLVEVAVDRSQDDIVESAESAPCRHLGIGEPVDGIRSVC